MGNEYTEPPAEDDASSPPTATPPATVLPIRRKKVAAPEPAPDGDAGADLHELAEDKADPPELADRRSKHMRAKDSLPKELQEVAARENGTLRDIVNALGTSGAFRIRVSRTEPHQVRDPVTNRMIPVNGFLRNYDTPIDEEMLQSNHGGGKFEVKFFRSNGKGGHTYYTQRTVEIVGDPRLDDTFRQPLSNAPTPAAQAPAAPSNDSVPLIKEVFGTLNRQLEHAQNQANRSHAPAGPDPGMAQVVELLKAQLQTQASEMAELRRELSAQRNVKPEKDPIQEKMFSAMLDGDSARMTSLRTQHDSEVRQLKDAAIENEKRLRDQFDRDRAELREAHNRQVALLEQTKNLQIQAVENSFNTMKQVLESENRRFKSENDSLKEEVKELRAKKEKGPLEIVKEAGQIKEALGLDEDGTDKSGWDKAIDALPAVVEGAKQFFGKGQQQQAGGNSNAAGGSGGDLQPTRKIVQDDQGNKYVLDAKGNLRPVKKKPPPPPQPGPDGSPPIPVIAPETIATVVTYLERAYAGNQDPEIVAQSGRSMVSEEIVTAIRDHGVDGFLSKVAKLPGTSPLANQAGRNWVRKVGKALVGE